MNAKRFRTNRHSFHVPLGLLFGLVVIAGLALTIATPVSGQVGPSCAAPPLGMVGWWSAEGNANDTTGNGHNGTYMEDRVAVKGEKDTDTQYTAGEVGQAFNFDGEEDFVVIKEDPALTPKSGITVDAWIFVNSSGQFFPSIIGKGNVGTSDESYALYLDTTGDVNFLLNTGGRFTAGPLPLTPNAWNFVAGTYNVATGALNVYVNGNVMSAHSAPPPNSAIHTTPNYDLLIGKADRTGSSLFSTSYFDGAIDEVELFDHALSRTQLLAIYTAATAGKCKCQEKPAEADGDIKDDDGHTSNVKMTAKRNCDDNGEVDYKDDSGEEVKGKNKSVAMSGNTSMVNGQGNLLDGTPVYYTIVMVGNQPLIGMNLFSITWTTPAGTFFHRSGVMLDGLISVPLP